MLIFCVVFANVQSTIKEQYFLFFTLQQILFIWSLIKSDSSVKVTANLFVLTIACTIYREKRNNVVYFISKLYNKEKNSQANLKNINSSVLSQHEFSFNKWINEWSIYGMIYQIKRSKHEDIILNRNNNSFFLRLKIYWNRQACDFILASVIWMKS